MPTNLLAGSQAIHASPSQSAPNGRYPSLCVVKALPYLVRAIVVRSTSRVSWVIAMKIRVSRPAPAR